MHARSRSYNLTSCEGIEGVTYGTPKSIPQDAKSCANSVGLGGAAWDAIDEYVPVAPLLGASPPPLFPLDRDLSNYNRSAVCDRSHVCGCGGGKCVLYGCRWTLLVAFTVLQMGDWRLRFCWDSLTWTDGAM